jgi:hypothetical protein
MRNWNVFDTAPKDHMKILLNFNAKVGRKDIFKPAIGNESLHKISNDNGVRLVNSATSINLRVKSTMFPYHNIHKYTCTSLDGKSHRLTIFWHLNILDVRSYKAADCDTDHYLVVTKLWKD